MRGNPFALSDGFARHFCYRAAGDEETKAAGPVPVGARVFLAWAGRLVCHNCPRACPRRLSAALPSLRGQDASSWHGFGTDSKCAGNVSSEATDGRRGVLPTQGIRRTSHQAPLRQAPLMHRTYALLHLISAVTELKPSRWYGNIIKMV